MSLISNNLKYLRRINGLTQESFARRIGTKRANVGAYEESRAVPPVETLKIIANTFGISVDDFVKKDIRKLRETPDLTFEFQPKSTDFEEKAPTRRSFVDDFENPPSIAQVMDEYFHQPSFTAPQPTTSPQPSFYEKQPSSPPTQPTFAEGPKTTAKGNIILIKKFQYNDYLTKFQDAKFIETLPTFSLPNLPFGEFRAFEAGEDFAFDGALLIGEVVKNLYDLLDGKNYVLLTKSQGIIYRRIYNRLSDKGTILLSADNHRFPTTEISIKDVLEAYEIKAFVSSQMPEPSKSFDKMKNLVEELTFELDRLRK